MFFGVTTQALLRQEIEQLKYLVEHHPDGSRLTRENMNLKTELKQLRASLAKGAGQSSARQLEQSHRYTLQLERQLRHFLARGNSNSECVYVHLCACMFVCVHAVGRM